MSIPHATSLTFFSFLISFQLQPLPPGSQFSTGATKSTPRSSSATCTKSLYKKMSSRRQRSRQSSSARITDDQIVDLLSKLQDLLPEARSRNSGRVSAAKVLQETCNHIRSLHQEVDDLSERLSELLATTDTSSAQAAIIRSLLMQ